MLNNAILAGGTWPRSRPRPSKGTRKTQHQWNIPCCPQEPARCQCDYERVFSSEKQEDDSTDKQVKTGRVGAEIGQNHLTVETPKLTYDLLKCDSPVIPSRRSNHLLSEDFHGASFDSCNSFGDIFDSFDTVTEASNLSLYPDADQVERGLADLKPRKISADSYGDLCSSNSQCCVLDYKFRNGSLRGSFGNVSLCALEAPRAFGVRDLRSETNLTMLKEHIISGQQYRDENANYLRLDDHKRNRLSRSESSLTDRFRDILIPLNSGYIAYEKRLHQRKPRTRYKVFSSKEEIQTDFEAFAMGYQGSLSYLKQRDIESCRVTGPGVNNGTAGRRTTFYIFTEKDKKEYLKIYIIGPRLVPPKHEVATLTDCFYSVSYLPERVGWYSINVLWHGKHVIGSPFRVLMLLPKQKVWFKMDEIAPSYQS